MYKKLVVNASPRSEKIDTRALLAFGPYAVLT